MRLTFLLFFSLAMFPDEPNSKIQPGEYPPLAAQNNIQGDVVFLRKDGIMAAESGHPLLIGPANQTVERLSIPTLEKAVFHFHLLKGKQTTEWNAVNRNRNNVSRFLRWLLRMKDTLEFEEAHSCAEYSGKIPENRIVIKQENSLAEIWIYKQVKCPETMQ